MVHPPDLTSAPTASDPHEVAAPLDAKLAQLIGRWRDPLVGLLMTWRVQDPSELAEEVFTELWLGRENFKGSWDDGNAVGAWLRGIAWNLASARRRRAARGPWPLTDEADSIPADSPDPGREAVAQERAAALREAIEALPDDQRAVVYMRGLECKRGFQVAQLLGLSERAVEGLYYRARKQLKEALSHQESKA